MRVTHTVAWALQRLRTVTRVRMRNRYRNRADTPEETRRSKALLRRAARSLARSNRERQQARKDET